MTTRTAVAAITGAAVLAATGVTGAVLVNSDSTTATSTSTVMGCNDWPVQLTTGECQAAGTIRYVSLTNLQGAVQFCKWKAANPGEWARLMAYSETGGTPASIVTWMGGHIRDDLEAYFATGAPEFIIKPNTAPNICGGKIVAPPVVAGVTPGQTDATVTIQTTP